MRHKPSPRDPKFSFLLDLDPTFEEWRAFASEWLMSRPTGKQKKQTALWLFFKEYLHELKLDKNPRSLLLDTLDAPPLSIVLDFDSYSEEAYSTINDHVCDFIDWVLNEKLSKEDAGAGQATLRNPFSRIRVHRADPKVLIDSVMKKFDPEYRFLLELDPEFEEWRQLAAVWGTTAPKSHQRKLTLLFTRYLPKVQIGKNPDALLDMNFKAPSLWDTLELGTVVKSYAYSIHGVISDFVAWVLKEKYSSLDADGNCIVSSHVHNPFPRIRERRSELQYKRLVGKLDKEFSFLLKLDPTFNEWRSYAVEWVSLYGCKTHRRPEGALARFFVYYFHDGNLDKTPRAFLASDSNIPPLSVIFESDSPTERNATIINDLVYDFIDWVLNEKLSYIDGDGYRSVPEGLRNPFSRIKKLPLNKGADLEFEYVLRLDPRMEDWRVLAKEWSEKQINGFGKKRSAVMFFLETCIHGQNLEKNPYNFLRSDYSKPDIEAFFVTSKGRKRPTADDTVILNYIGSFLQWVLEEKLSVDDEMGNRYVPQVYKNPLSRVSTPGSGSAETLKIPLAYSYIRELRAMLAQGPTFKDWRWAQSAMAGESDWFVVEPSVVRHDDTDCVWRKRETNKYERTTLGFPAEVIELWSPVRAVTLYLKLELPLRTFQVRVLDSGETDTWRYDQGKWRLNDSPLTVGSPSRPSQRGVFHRSSNETGAGFYINTNKTADIDKPEAEKGYVIPWTHEPALYWLEKLRDWQETYNPVTTPTPWVELEAKHFGSHRPHDAILQERGASCFLFRDAAAAAPADRKKPIASSALDRFWYLLLEELEKRCVARGETLDNGAGISFVYPERWTKTYYPLHALRVSLITAYALDGGVPFPVLSKLIVGHARLIMTLYYTKAGKAHITEVMREAEKRILENEAASYRRFLLEKAYHEIEEQFAFNSADAVSAAALQKSGAGFVFEDKGICPVGGGLCDIGGDLVKGKEASKDRVYAPVPGYPLERNCCRCRFFLTGPGFLPGLQAHANVLSYKIAECSTRFVKLDEQVRALEDARLVCENNDQIFTGHQQLQRVSRYYEEESERANKLLTDLQATVRLVDRSISILAKREAKGGIHLVAAGDLADIKYALVETDSEMYHLAVICENAVIYPNVDANSATLRRSQVLDLMLQLNGHPPVFFRLSPEEQLLIGNEMMELLRARTGSLKTAVEFAEGKLLLAEYGLLEDAISVIEDRVGGISYRQIIKVDDEPRSELRPESAAKKEIAYAS